MIRKPKPLRANARFNTVTKRKLIQKGYFKEYRRKSARKRLITLPKARKVVARLPGVPAISPSLKNATK
mgnify:FL=1